MAVSLQVVVFHVSALYRFKGFGELFGQLRRLVLAWTPIFATLIVVGFFVKAGDLFSRGWLVIWFASGLALLIGLRIVLRLLFRRWAKAGRVQRRAIIIGAGPEGARLLTALAEAVGDERRVIVGDDAAEEDENVDRPEAPLDPERQEHQRPAIAVGDRDENRAHTRSERPVPGREPIEALEGVAARRAFRRAPRGLGGGEGGEHLDPHPRIGGLGAGGPGHHRQDATARPWRESRRPSRVSLTETAATRITIARIAGAAQPIGPRKGSPTNISLVAGSVSGHAPCAARRRCAGRGFPSQPICSIAK
ncbi:MAG: hypothetical protein FJX67_09725 [Alphaproteobacteria bacterium]|nr:hypothetical protein [Alphaproteobacteria bacterium]